MAFSSGTFSLVAGNPVVTGTTISSTWANNTLSDVATGLSTCLLKDGTQTATALVPFASGISLSGGSNFTAYTTANFFTGTWTGFSATLTATIHATLIGNVVTLKIPQTSGTSNSLNKTITGMPAALRPTTTTSFYIAIEDNGAVGTTPGWAQLDSGGVMTLFANDAQGAWTASGTCSIPVNGACTVSYTLD